MARGRRTFKDRGNLLQRAVDYYEQGRSMQSIAGTLHVSTATVYNLLVEAGVTTRPRGRPVTV